MNLRTMPNAMPQMRIFACHQLSISGLCPISGNPQPGSSLTICYRPKTCFLEVYTLTHYIQSYRGGRQIGTVFVRNMEQTIQQIAQDCAATLGVFVKVRADLLLQHGQRMRLVSRARPTEGER